MDGKTDDSLIATGFLRAGPRVLFREKDNPERRFDYLDDVIGTIGKGMLGLTVNCARCHDHKFDPIRQKDYYALQASIFGYVETDGAAGAAARGRGLPGRRTTRSTPAATELRGKLAAIEKPHRDRLELEQIKSAVLRTRSTRPPPSPRASGRPASSCWRCRSSRRSTSPARGRSTRR